MIQKLSDERLHKETKLAAKSEKMATIVLLNHLHEVNRRKLFADFGHSSLQKYIMKELGYSEGESWTRIQAMKLVEKAPEVKPMIESGELSLFNAALVHQQVKDNPEDTKKIIEEAKGKTSRQLQDEIKPKTQKKIILPERILNKIKKLGWDQSELEVFEALLDEKLKETSKKGHADESKVSRYIPVETKREVIKRSEHKCEFPGCRERRNLQWDHIKPFALGGDRSVKNIRLLCRAHNQRRAIKTFGATETQRYFSSKTMGQ